MAAQPGRHPIHRRGHVSEAMPRHQKRELDRAMAQAQLAARPGPAWPHTLLSSLSFSSPLLSVSPPLPFASLFAMAMATSTFSPRPATLNKPLRAGIQLHLIPFPHLRAGRLVCATAAGEAPPVEQRDEAELAPAADSNGATVKAEAPAAKTEPPPAPAPVPAFRDARWVNGTWDLTKFDKGGVVDWDAVIDAGEDSDSLIPPS